MSKSSSHNHEKIIQKILDDLSMNKYSTITAVTHIYAISLSILVHHHQEHQNQALKHAAYQLLTSNEKKILEK